ncbi:SDR family oxidoreductase [Methylobacterium nodulans]|uniref:NAD-dependent epimerase/dehydratase n=1 Tax=Methylobacterium nodulans (strain LMG 21967 / CNCM I-2342 / ORS 2060) TaxID=460265 RepID=B8IMS2_METNO|nr:SDR family oxidoreductase [Methylobacterium nodulans]ACL60265.1 NAD-dependent epimerase/dehydratase [Methylobacterium nodulans ORS 2060]
MNLFVFGLGYTAGHFVERERGGFARVAATAQALRAPAPEGVAMRIFSPGEADPRIVEDLARSDAILVSVPPQDGDPVLRAYADAIAASPARWIGYLSTIGVYGDQGGAWIDEATPPAPTHARTRERVAVEEAWLALGARTAKAVQIFRLSGIYGPGRNAFVKLREGRAQRIVKAGQVFNRIHVDDIATALAASLDRPRAGAIYNVTDDEPAPPQDVTAFAAALAGLPLPPEVDFDTAALSPMARSFYGENKRVRNRRLKEELGVTLRFPTYREGLRGLMEGAPAVHVRAGAEG